MQTTTERAYRNDIFCLTTHGSPCFTLPLPLLTILILYISLNFHFPERKIIRFNILLENFIINRYFHKNPTWYKTHLVFLWYMKWFLFCTYNNLNLSILYSYFKWMNGKTASEEFTEFCVHWKNAQSIKSVIT